MKCDVCRKEKENVRKYDVKDLEVPQVTICTSCLMRGVSAKGGTGAVITEDKVMPPPLLMLHISAENTCSDIDRFTAIAEEEGCAWMATDAGRHQKAPVIFTEDEGNIVYLDLHLEMAKKNTYFRKDGLWHKDVALWPYECFRRSCRTVRDYYVAWLNR